MTTSRRAMQRARLLSDGRKALALLQSGKNVSDCLMALGSSRARFYRALRAAAAELAVDPLLS